MFSDNTHNFHWIPKQTHGYIRKYSPNWIKSEIHYIENEESCLHESCSECHGTGRKHNGGMCIHMISCPCKKCTPQMMCL